MDDEKIWTIYFAGVGSIRFHPRNVHLKKKDQVVLELHLAAILADEMLKLHRRRFKCSDQSSAAR